MKKWLVFGLVVAVLLTMGCLSAQKVQNNNSIATKNNTSLNQPMLGFIRGIIDVLYINSSKLKECYIIRAGKVVVNASGVKSLLVKLNEHSLLVNKTGIYILNGSKVVQKLNIS